MKAKFIQVEVSKDMVSVIPVVIPEYEFPLLQYANGDDVGGDGDVGKVIKTGDTNQFFHYENPRQVYESMQQKYRSTPDGKFVVDEVYGNYGNFAKALTSMDVGGDDDNKSSHTVAEMKEIIPTLTDDELSQLLDSDSRKGVVDAVNAELGKRTQ